MQKIAAVTGGAYVRATSQSMRLQEVIDMINRTEKSKFSAEVFEEYNERYQYPLAAALALLILELLILPRRNRVLAKFNVFSKSKEPKI